MSRFILAGASIVTPAEVRTRSALVIEHDKISDIVDESDVDPALTVDLEGGYLVPGFIDIQVNGGGGVLLNDRPEVDGLRTIAEAHLRFGTTSLLPTLISDSPRQIALAMEAVDDAIAQDVPGVIGLHIEGPYLNSTKRGIHDASKIAPLTEEALSLLIRPGRGKRIVTLAPELAPKGTISRLRQAGVIVCAGHSLATYEQCRGALDEGLDGFTHLFNAMTQLGSREPGMVGAALEDRRSRFGMIVDGYHVHPAAMRIAVAARGPDGLMLVTDAMPTVGSDKREFRLGDTVIIEDKGALRGPDGTLAGSNLDMASAFRNARAMLGLDLVQACRAASTNAAIFLGLAHERGAIAPGLIADLVHLSDDLQVRRVWTGGHCRWECD